MRITVEREVLLKGIVSVQNAVNTRGSLPILANILVEANRQALKLTTTDLDIAVSVHLEAKIEEEVAKRLGEKSLASTTTETETQPDLETEQAKAAITNNNGQSSNEESLIQKLKQSFSVEVSN